MTEPVDDLAVSQIAPTRSHVGRRAFGVPRDKATVRVATFADVAGVVKLRVQVAEEGNWIGAEAPIDTADAARDLRTILGDEEHGVFVADIDGSIGGMAAVSFSTRGVTEFGMMVAANQRGRGIGAELLDQVIGWSRGRGAHKVSLQVWLHNQPARALYDRAGFEIEGVLRGHYRRRNGELWDAMIMGLRLDNTEI